MARRARRPIPSKADLMFRVELFKVTPRSRPMPAAWAKVTPWPTDSNDVVRKPSGLEYLAVESGDPNGVPPTDRDFVYVHFEGRLEDGSSGQVDLRNAGACSLPDGGPDAGLERADEGLMRPGDHWMVRMPPNLMYGAEGDGRIPPNATVIYEVRLDTVIYIDPPADPKAPSDPK